MADYTKQDIYDIITEYMQTYGSAIGSGAVHELTPEELTDENLRVLTIPGMRPDNQKWVQTSMKNMILPITNAVSDITTLKQQTIQVRDEASAAAINANNMATEASRVNATLVGMTVTVVDRNGQSSSVNIGFEIYDTYGSVAEMNADAANVPVGKFVMIATSDPTDPENARLYGRNSNPATSANPFTFLSDLDQASAQAWADWLDNMKPQIEAVIAQAASDHTRANTDHSTATSDHSTAQSDHTTSTEKSAYAKQQGDYAKAQGDIMASWNAHQPYIGNGTTGDANYWYIWVNGAYVKSVYAKGDDLHWEEMTQEEKDDFFQKALDKLVIATPQETRAMLNELT